MSRPEFRTPCLTTDVVLFTPVHQADISTRWDGWQDDRPDSRGPAPSSAGWHVLLIGRVNPPYPASEGYFCLPGGFVDYGENPLRAAVRELWEETGLVDVSRDFVPDLTTDEHLEFWASTLQLVDVYGEPDRDPRRHVVTVAYKTELRSEIATRLRGSDDAQFCQWVEVVKILDGTTPMGFDHRKIVSDAFQLKRGVYGKSQDDFNL